MVKQWSSNFRGEPNLVETDVLSSRQPLPPGHNIPHTRMVFKPFFCMYGKKPAPQPITICNVLTGKHGKIHSRPSRRETHLRNTQYGQTPCFNSLPHGKREIRQRSIQCSRAPCFNSLLPSGQWNCRLAIGYRVSV